MVPCGIHRNTVVARRVCWQGRFHFSPICHPFHVLPSLFSRFLYVIHVCLFHCTSANRLLPLRTRICRSFEGSRLERVSARILHVGASRTESIAGLEESGRSHGLEIIYYNRYDRNRVICCCTEAFWKTSEALPRHPPNSAPHSKVPNRTALYYGPVIARKGIELFSRLLLTPSRRSTSEDKVEPIATVDYH